MSLAMSEEQSKRVDGLSVEHMGTKQKLAAEDSNRKKVIEVLTKDEMLSIQEISERVGLRYERTSRLLWRMLQYEEVERYNSFWSLKAVE